MIGMKKRRLITYMCIAVLVISFTILWIPRHQEISMTVATVSGETAVVEMDIWYYSRHVGPEYVKGTVSVNDERYIDRYTKLKEFPSVKDNRLLPQSWWKNTSDVPYNMVFYKMSCEDIIKSEQNQLIFLGLRQEKGTTEVHFAYLDEDMSEKGHITGISYYGPAENAKQAQEIAAKFRSDNIQ